MARRKKAKTKRPVKGKCPSGYHKSKTAKTKSVCVRNIRKKRNKRNVNINIKPSFSVVKL